jgi:predicted enzyme related to lactoylglutathione lyase
VIRVPDLEAALTGVTDNGGTVVVPTFELPGVGRGAYITDPTGVLIGVHAYLAG